MNEPNESTVDGVKLTVTSDNESPLEVTTDISCVVKPDYDAICTAFSATTDACKDLPKEHAIRVLKAASVALGLGEKEQP